VAWTLRGRVETAFAAPDGTPEKAYFTYMTNDALAKWEGGLGITGTPFDTATIKTWVKKTDYPYNWSNLAASVVKGQIPPPWKYGLHWHVQSHWHFLRLFCCRANLLGADSWSKRFLG
jgi:hypothetical protein